MFFQKLFIATAVLFEPKCFAKLAQAYGQRKGCGGRAAVAARQRSRWTANPGASPVSFA